MDGVIVFVIVVLLFIIFGKKKKIPSHVKPIPSIELEMPIIYDCQISINDREIFDTISFKSRGHDGHILKNKSSRTKYEIVLDASRFLNVRDDSFTVEVAYQKGKERKDVQYVNPHLEIDYGLSYVDNGKFIDDIDVMEKKFPLQDKGREKLEFAGVEAIASKRDSFRRKK